MGASHANETVAKASFTSLINLLIFPQKRLDQTAYSCIVLQSNKFTSDETVAGKANVNDCSVSWLHRWNSSSVSTHQSFGR